MLTFQGYFKGPTIMLLLSWETRERVIKEVWVISECEIFLAIIKLSRPVPSLEVQYFLGRWGLPSYTVLDSPDEWGVPAIQ